MFSTYHLEFFLNIHQYVYDIDEGHRYLMHIILTPKKHQPMKIDYEEIKMNYLLEFYNQV
jgi:hypothetical protein